MRNNKAESIESIKAIGYEFRKVKGVNIMAMRSLCKEEKKGLKILADDFRFLHRKDVQEIIETCKSYAEGQ